MICEVVAELPEEPMPKVSANEINEINNEGIYVASVYGKKYKLHSVGGRHDWLWCVIENSWNTFGKQCKSLKSAIKSIQDEGGRVIRCDTEKEFYEWGLKRED